MATFTTKYGYISGFEISRNATNPAYKIDVQIGECADTDDKYQVKTDAVLTIDITQAGANGLDTGSEAASTWYYVFIIKNMTTDTIAGLLSTSATAPTMPSGYTVKRRIGSVYNDSSSDFLAFTARGNGLSRKIFYHTPTSVLSAGNATTWTDVDCSTPVPATSRVAIAQIMVRETTARCRFMFRENGVSGDGNRVGGYDQVEAYAEIPVDTNQKFEYKVNSSSESGYCKITGYMEDL